MVKYQAFWSTVGAQWQQARIPWFELRRSLARMFVVAKVNMYGAHAYKGKDQAQNSCSEDRISCAAHPERDALHQRVSDDQPQRRSAQRLAVLI